LFFLFFERESQMKIAATILTMLALMAGPLYGGAGDQPPPMPDQEQPEVLTRGPVHEAFAEPVNLQVQAGVVAPQEPPAKIDEMPPAERPAGDQFVWVPGYWSWDADRNGYIWVSACWRAAPPSMYWVPGYWSQVPEGWEWVAGFWAPSSPQKIDYLPSPPAYDDVQPPGPPPSEDSIWVPPCQYWYQDHYILRPGYWLRELPGWVWVPSHYTWTPRGYVFVEGHWDYSLDRRGVLFAPVYFPRPIREREGFSYSPSIVIDIGALRFSLFAYPRYSHYYFGDYFDDAYLAIGIYPRFQSEGSHMWYDPIYVHDRWRNRRTEPLWQEHERQEYDLRRASVDLRPPRTYRELETRQATLPESQRKDVQMARPLTAVVAATKTTPLTFQKINGGTQKRIVTQATSVQKFRENRIRWESTTTEPKTAQPATERKAPATPLIERKEPTPKPTQSVSPISPPTERKTTVTPQIERREPTPTPVQGASPVSPPSERRGTVTPQIERKEPASAPAQGTSPTSPSSERRGAVTPQTQRKEPVSAPAQGAGPASPPTPRTAPLVSPRPVQVTKPETVKVPTPPIAGKPAASLKKDVVPPPKPAGEHQSASNSKNQDASKSKEKEKSN
jgi:hypothetical protein